VLIEIRVGGNEREIRRFADVLQAALGDDGEVQLRLGSADRGDQLKPGTVSVDVFEAGDEAEALDRVQPAVRQADPELRLVEGGTWTRQLIVPKPPDRRD
jgi:hypothetical protein